MYTILCQVKVWYIMRTQGSLSGLALVPRNASNDAKAVRDQYCEYFNNEGSVPWQDNYLMDSKIPCSFICISLPLNIKILILDSMNY